MRSKAIISALVLVLVACGLATAQVNPDNVYSLTYFDNNIQNGPLDATIRIINPGTSGSPISGDEGTQCANLYVFDDTQEMVECCSCPITANGLLTFRVQEVTENPLTVFPVRGVIKMIASSPSPICDATFTALLDPPLLRGFATHLQNPRAPGNLAPFPLAVTEERFADAPLSFVEQNDLGTICSFVRYLGTGRGRCDEVCEEPLGIGGN
jgi:hypothetical protein